MPAATKVSSRVWACLSGILMGSRKASHILPSHTPQVFSDWLEGKKPISHQKINVVTAQSTSHVAVRLFVSVRTKKRLWHMASEAWDYTGIHRDWLQNAWEWDPHMQEHSRPHFLKCPCVALHQGSLQNRRYIFVLVPLDLRKQCTVNRCVIMWSHF